MRRHPEYFWLVYAGLSHGKPQWMTEDRYKKKLAQHRLRQKQRWRIDAGHRRRKQTYDKLRYLTLKETIKIRSRAYYALNRDKRIAAVMRYTRKKLRSDPAFRTVYLLRCNFLRAVKKSHTWFKLQELIGCSKEQFLQHVQSKFLPGMSWENHGKWHLDHVHPCSSFDLSDPVQQRICFNFKNIQPLWAKDNLSKGVK